MASLREQVQRAIAGAPSTEQAAIAVCVLLDEHIGLSGNGWFDDDEIVLGAIRESYQDDGQLSLEGIEVEVVDLDAILDANEANYGSH